MLVLFATPLLLFPLHLVRQHFWSALTTGVLTVLLYAGVLVFGGRWIRTTRDGNARGPLRRAFLRRFRRLVGIGDIIQSVARYIDPQWKNPFSGRVPAETVKWLTTMELLHWSALVGSVPPMTAAFAYGYQMFVIIYLLANLVYNIAPILVIQNTRQRLQQVARMRGAVVTDDKP
jgi:hypothetical protein